MKPTVAERLTAAIQLVRDNLKSYTNMTRDSACEGLFNFRDPHLLQARRRNIDSICHELNNIIEQLENAKNPPDSNNRGHYITSVREAIARGLRRNKGLSAEHGYIHRSYKENQLAGFGFFSSWRLKTFFQSRATRIMEKSLEYIDNFEANLTKICEREPNIGSLQYKDFPN